MTSRRLEWEVTSRGQPEDYRIFSAYRHQAVHSDSGRRGEFTVIDSPDWANIIAITPDEQVILVRQFRHGTGEITLEIPGGIVDDGEDFVTAARRELREETGYRCNEVELLGVVEPNPAFMNNRCGLVLARGVHLDSGQDLDPEEFIDVVRYPLSEIPALIADGRITHSLVVSAFYFLSQHP